METTPPPPTSSDPAAGRTRRRRGPAKGSSQSTEHAFLDAAERIFGTSGYDGATVRAIAEAAGANLGALHYYWGSKEALFRAMCERRLRPVAELRLQRLEACVADAGGRTPPLQAVLQAAIEPALLHADESPELREVMRKLLARILSDPSAEVRQVLSDIFDEASFRYVRLLRQCCPHLDDNSFYWRLHGVLGTTQHASAGVERLARLSQGKFDGNNVQQGTRELVHMLQALLMAPPLAAEPAIAASARRRSKPAP